MGIIERVSIPEQAKGRFKVERFTTDRTDFGALLSGRSVPVGETFTRLMRAGTVVMSDTPAEMRDHYAPVHAATGSCLINGLGIGMVLGAILRKPTVTDVTVVELEQDVIDLVGPTYLTDPRVTIVCADAMTYQPPKGKRFGMVWHDIWDNITTENLPQMATLHRRYGRRADWQGSWCRYECERARRSGW